MRALIQLSLRPPQDHYEDDGALTDWLAKSGFRPQAVSLPPEVMRQLRHDDEQRAVAETESSDIGDIDPAADHAAEILRSIPRYDRERRQALKTVKYVIRFDDSHGDTVWGVVCVDKPTITVRWRHRTTRSLERATEALVQKVWESAHESGLFMPFKEGQRIPVREPLITSNAYYGEILPPGNELIVKARRDKNIEIKVAQIALYTALSCLAIAFVTFYWSRPDTAVRWLSGFFDRLATTAAATSVVSYLNYYFHLKNLQSKPYVDWK